MMPRTLSKTTLQLLRTQSLNAFRALSTSSSSINFTPTTSSTLTPFTPARSFSISGFSNYSPSEGDHPVPNSEMAMGYNSTDNLIEDNRLDRENIADPTNRTFQYLVSGSTAFIFASLGRAYVNRFVASLSASADVMALASIEVDISHIAEGSASTFKWRGKPVFVRYRTPQEIEMARADDHVSMRDPAIDADRFVKPEYAILIGICTHLGCVPMNAAGDYGGWFCPCHGSHYDTSGRIRKGPAPLNFEIPPYKFLSDKTILLG
jgi:ubiquinol-cytochrome c reductase iron-sulfur subunit